MNSTTQSVQKTYSAGQVVNAPAEYFGVEGRCTVQVEIVGPAEPLFLWGEDYNAGSYMVRMNGGAEMIIHYDFFS